MSKDNSLIDFRESLLKVSELTRTPVQFISRPVYLVTCDETNNTAESIADHILNVYVAYAEKGCAEFVVVKLSRELSAE